MNPFILTISIAVIIISLLITCLRDLFYQQELTFYGIVHLVAFLSLVVLVFFHFRKKNKKIQENEDLIDAIFKNMPCAINAITANYEIYLLNEQAEKLLGVKEDVIGQKCYDVWGKGYICNDCAVEKTLVTKKANKSVKNCNIKGHKFYTEQTAVPIFDHNGAIKYVLKIILDTTHNIELEKENDEFFLQTVISLSKLIEKRDPYTATHSTRVQKIAVAMGKSLNLSNQLIEEISIAALLHDIGKIGIPEGILNKPGKLTEEEFAIIKTHPQIGYEAVKNIKPLTIVARYIRYHHERIDGSGYPQQKKGNEIPLVSRILSVADVYEALTSDRVYRQAMTRSQALEIMNKEKGIGFEPKIVDALIAVLEDI